MSVMIPGSGSVHEPGLRGVAPGSGVIMCPPVSVCHQVSTIGQRPPPTTVWYHIHASGLIASPTLPGQRSIVGSYLFGKLPPVLMGVPTAVGAVYHNVTLRAW